ncbi:MAG: amidohydrolase family protein [Gammaproteobacteria bacterium]
MPTGVAADGARPYHEPSAGDRAVRQDPATASRNSLMLYDTVIRNARVIDGTGMPSFVSDVAIAGGRIAKIGKVAAPGKRDIDAAGLVLAPGFIDVHTHYDVQLDWDPTASSACWHGVTSVLVGNCGFTLAPSRPEDVDWLARMLCRVEGMSIQALREGLKFKGGSFADYWKRFDGRLGVNVGSLVGHSALRRYVMGAAASERAATAGEIEAMQALLRQSLREGAMGFSTSQLSVHADDEGKPVPSNLATPEEIVALSAVLAEFDRGTLEIFTRTMGKGYDPEDRKLILDMYAASGRPIEIDFPSPVAYKRAFEFYGEAMAQGVRLHPQFMANRGGLHLKLADTFLFDELPAWKEVLTRPEPQRSQMLRDPEVRARLRADWNSDKPREVSIIHWSTLEVELADTPRNAALAGRSVQEIADARGADPLDVFLDVSLSEALKVQWKVRDNEEARRFLHKLTRMGIQHPMSVPGSSDGGAHLNSFTGADYTTRFLTEYVPEAIGLEQAIHRLTLMPATVHGLTDRGVIREGAWADLVLMDMKRLGVGEMRLQRDFPCDSERYVVESHGYVATFVNGVQLIEEGRHTGALPGHVLRGS